MHLEFKSVSTRPDPVSVSGEEADWSYEEADEKLVVRLAENAGEVRVEAKF